MNDQAPSVASAKQSQVTEQVAVFEELLTNAYSLWESLTTRLAGVTREEPSASDRSGDVAKAPLLVPLAAQLHGLNNRLSCLTERMRDTLKKLEL